MRNIIGKAWGGIAGAGRVFGALSCLVGALNIFSDNACAVGLGTRNIRDIPGAPESLARIVSPKFYRTLLISPVEGWIVVRGWLSGTHLEGSRVIHSELNGLYDSVALDLANNLQVLGLAPERTARPTPVLVHLLVYQAADGKLALSFANSDEVGGSQFRYYGAAWMAVQKPNHLWVPIEPLQRAAFDKRGPRAYTMLAVRPGQEGLGRGVGQPRLMVR